MMVGYAIHTVPPSLMVLWSHSEISHGTQSDLKQVDSVDPTLKKKIDYAKYVILIAQGVTV